MIKKNIYKEIILYILLFNVLNIFLLTTSIGYMDFDGVKEGTTFFESVKNTLSLSTFYMYDMKSGNKWLQLNTNSIFLILLFFSIFALVFFLRKKGQYNPYAKDNYMSIMLIACFGIVLHLFVFMCYIPTCSEHTETLYLSAIKYGSFGNFLFIFNYLAVIIFSLLISKSNDTMININEGSIIMYAILIELIILFFGCSLLGNITYTLKTPAGDSTKKMSTFFSSSWEMMFKHKNIFNLEGKEESYGYLSIILISYIASFVLSFIKKKWCNISIIALLSLSLIIYFIFSIDILNSFYARYATLNNVNLFSVFSIKYFVMFGLIVFAIFIQTQKLITQKENAVIEEQY